MWSHNKGGKFYFFFPLSFQIKLLAPCYVQWFSEVIRRTPDLKIHSVKSNLQSSTFIIIGLMLSQFF